MDNQFNNHPLRNLKSQIATSSWMKRGVFCVVALCGFGLCGTAHAAGTFPAVKLIGVSPVQFDGPAHHGLLLSTSGIPNPNLRHYEIQLKPDSGGPLPPWMVYTTTAKPFDGAQIAVPYRSGFLALVANQKYCVRLRAVYGKTVTAWSDVCGLQLDLGTMANGDADGDSIADEQEYALGLDPFSADTDQDGVEDGVEVANATDPNKPLFPKLVVTTPVIDFGSGNAFGSLLTQHQVIEIINNGDQPAKLLKLTVNDGALAGSAAAFQVGQFPEVLSHIPPQHIAKIPVSFLPQWSGFQEAMVTIETTNPTPLAPIALKGVGSGLSTCGIDPMQLDFGTVPIGSPQPAVQYFTIANQGASEAPLSFTVSVSDPLFVPGLQGIVLPVGKSLKIPVVFRAITPGTVQATLTVRTADCGEHIIALKATAE